MNKSLKSQDQTEYWDELLKALRALGEMQTNEKKGTIKFFQGTGRNSMEVRGVAELRKFFSTIDWEKIAGDHAGGSMMSLDEEKALKKALGFEKINEVIQIVFCHKEQAEAEGIEEVYGQIREMLLKQPKFVALCITILDTEQWLKVEPWIIEQVKAWCLQADIKGKLSIEADEKERILSLVERQMIKCIYMQEQIWKEVFKDKENSAIEWIRAGVPVKEGVLTALLSSDQGAVRILREIEPKQVIDISDPVCKRVWNQWNQLPFGKLRTDLCGELVKIVPVSNEVVENLLWSPVEELLLLKKDGWNQIDNDKLKEWSKKMRLLGNIEGSDFLKSNHEWVDLVKEINEPKGEGPSKKYML